MGDLRQSVRFTSSLDGVRLAYAVSGRGHPLVRVPTWISHVEHDWQSPVMRHLVVELASRHKLVNYDCRGVGMSERDVSDMSFDVWVHDLEAVADAAGLERFALWGISGGPAVAIAYAVRHPDRVSRRDQRKPEGQPERRDRSERHEATEHHEIALGEIDGLGCLVDQREAERDQTEHAPHGNTADDKLKELGHDPLPHRCSELSRLRMSASVVRATSPGRQRLPSIPTGWSRAARCPIDGHARRRKRARTARSGPV
jgi:hypothetical protein